MRCWFKHYDHVDEETISPFGADFVCHRCGRREWSQWTSSIQCIYARIYLDTKKSDAMLKRFMEYKKKPTKRSARLKSSK